MGAEAEHIFKSFTFGSAGDGDKYAKVMAKFDEHFIPKRNVIFERAKFHSRVQLPGESVEAFVRQLYELAENCEFGAQKDEQMRDRLVIGIRDRQVSQKLQMKSDLTLRTAIEMARHCELIQSQNTEGGKGPEHVDNIKSVRKTEQKRTGMSAKINKKTIRGACTRCGRNHADREQCPAKGKKCLKCNKTGHFASVCYSKTAVREITEADEDDTMFLGSVELKQSKDALLAEDEPPWRTTLTLGDTPVSFKIDSGADTSVMSEATYETLRSKPKLSAVKNTIQSPGGVVATRGQFLAKIKARVNGQLQNCCFRVVVVKTNGENLLSRTVATKLGLIKRIDEISTFSGLGTLKGEPVKITLKDGAQPYSIATPRRVPIPLLPKVEEELKRMEAMGIIEEVTEPTEWCAPMVPVMKKNGKIRVCVDLKRLNENVKREKFILPTLDDILPKLAKGTVFSSLDAESGFWQITLEENSARLTTFITPLGRYCFKRLPFGITSAPEIFQRKMSELLRGHDGTVVFMDDILVTGETQEIHDQRLKQVMETIKAAGLRLNKDKCRLSQPELNFLGQVVTKDGITPNPERVKAITAMEPPQNVSELRRLLGMVNYIGRYLPNLSTVLQSLNELLKSERDWCWGPLQDRAFTEVKQLISSAPVLGFFDPAKPTVVSADASSYGLGGVLLQSHDGALKPVAFCSRTLTKAEKRYAQIEKECLAGVWASERFYQYLCGLESYRLLTDHKPLVTLINSKDLDTTPIRCQRLLIRLMKFNPVAEYVPGKHLVVADALSRQPLGDTAPADLEAEVKAYVDSVEDDHRVRKPTIEQIKDETRKDGELQCALKYVHNGWPEHLKSIAVQAHAYFKDRGSLSEANGLLRRGKQIVIPKSMREHMLQKIHEGHQGLTKCRERYRGAVWWPGIAGKVKNLVLSCEHCKIHRPSQHREPLITTPLPDLPWQKLAADLCEHKGHHYLIVIDYFSRWLEILNLPKTNSDTVIQKLKSIFTRFGTPEELMTDNGPQFSADQFRRFAAEYNFQHVTSSPHFPQSNGAAERAVKTAKWILKQADPHLALLSYRSTPTEPTRESPAKLLMGREIRTTLPVLKERLQPMWPNLETVRANDAKAKLSYEKYYNRMYSTQPLPPLTIGDKVRLKIDGEKAWTTTATVQRRETAPRSFTLETERGDTPRRNRRHIQLVNQESSSPPKMETSPPNDQHVQSVPARQDFSATRAYVPADTPGPPQLSAQVVTRFGRTVKPNHKYAS
ncbi:uncharacterized protein K02A2.6-like [Trichomycterus rosablanca]|uniref:uncharacterized protein K02A2.6-like n=1 Tax=Trichomycterus rosablanca TaxID=2290929 RepID=UPI002F35F025